MHGHLSSVRFVLGMVAAPKPSIAIAEAMGNGDWEKGCFASADSINNTTRQSSTVRRTTYWSGTA
jgi:hypothetical protein